MNIPVGLLLIFLLDSDNEGLKLVEEISKKESISYIQIISSYFSSPFNIKNKSIILKENSRTDEYKKTKMLKVVNSNYIPITIETEFHDYHPGSKATITVSQGMISFDFLNTNNDNNNINVTFLWKKAY